MSRVAASTECAEKPRKRTLPAFFAASKASMAPPGAEDRLDVGLLRHRVVLVEVEVVGAHLPQGALELLGRGLLRPTLGLAREEDALAVRLERGAEHVLGVSVARGDVEVVDARVDRRAHARGRLLGRRVHHHDPAEADHRELLARPPEGPPLEAARPVLPLEPLEARGKERQRRARPRRPDHEVAPLHGMPPPRRPTARQARIRPSRGGVTDGADADGRPGRSAAEGPAGLAAPRGPRDRGRRRRRGGDPPAAPAGLRRPRDARRTATSRRTRPSSTRFGSPGPGSRSSSSRRARRPSS